MTAPQHQPQTGGPYRSRDTTLFGVCKGMADFLNFPVFWFRVIVVVTTLFTGIWPVIIAYIVAALIMKPEPIVPFESDSDAEFYNSYTTSKSMALHRLKDTFDNLDRRIQRMESIVTSTKYSWDERLNNER